MTMSSATMMGIVGVVGADTATAIPLVVMSGSRLKGQKDEDDEENVEEEKEEMGVCRLDAQLVSEVGSTL